MNPGAVLDTSISIDLYRGGMLQAVFRLPIQFMVPDIMYEQELAEWFGPDMRDLGLIVTEVEPEGVELARDYARNCSTCDAHALALAVTQEIELFTGDQDLRTFAEGVGIRCRGLFALFDLIEEAQLMSPVTLYSSLTTICRHPRKRLPPFEVESRLARYQGLKPIIVT